MFRLYRNVLTIGHYSAKPFNFFVSPVVDPMFALDRTFLCQSSAMEMLCKEGMDFNRLLRHGIRYLSRDEENAIRSLEAHRMDGTRENIIIDECGEQFLSDVTYSHHPLIEMTLDWKFKIGSMILLRKSLIVAIFQLHRRITSAFCIKVYRQCFQI